MAISNIARANIIRTIRHRHRVPRLFMAAVVFTCLSALLGGLAAVAIAGPSYWLAGSNLGAILTLLAPLVSRRLARR